jgi:D-beta-D-heptose 7-phosphate kinase/D-beta-D-heptose 1-phosphate adenosyltransferase
MTQKIAIIGETCVDQYVYGTCDRVCPEAAALCFKSSGKISSNLGMAGNVYNNMIAIGSDNYSIDLITNKNNIVKKRFIDDRYNTIVFREDINDHSDRIDIDQYDLNKYDCVVFSDYDKGFLNKIDIETISTIIKSHHDIPIFIDTKKKISNFVQNIDFIKINSYEFNNNISDLDTVIKDSNLIVTEGDCGATLYTKSSTPVSFPTEKILLRDVCGAGDTFLAGLVIEFLKNKDISQAINFANKVSAQVVSKFGVVVP